MRVLGVDPGLSRCGIGVVEGSPLRPRAVRISVARTPAGDAVPRRLARLHDALRTVLLETRPDAVAVERVFYGSNTSTAIGVAQAAGLALLLAEQAGLPVVEYTPSEVKAAIAGHGAADKEQIMFMVRAQLRLTEVPRPADAADALALALCHLQRGAAHVGAAGDSLGAATMSPRLAAAVAAAGPGAQVVRAGGAR